MSSLSSDELSLWRAWAEARPETASPLVQPALAAEVHAVRGDVEVIIQRDAAGPTAFLPIRRRGTSGASYLDCLAGMNALITHPDRDDATKLEQLADAANLKRLELPCLPSFSSAERPVATSDYPFIDLSNGFEAYRRERKAAKSDELTTALRKTRKFEREVGTLEFELHSTDAVALATLLRWKAAQLESRQLVNHLQQPWIDQLFTRLLALRPKHEFAPLFSTLSFDGQLLAASLGVRSRTVLHGWVMAFNGDFYKYSPGLLLLAQILQNAEPNGIQRIDMGRGSEGYKQSFRSGGFEVVDKTVDSRPIRRAATRTYAAAKRLVESSPLAEFARGSVRQLRWLLRSRQDQSPLRS